MRDATPPPQTGGAFADYTRKVSQAFYPMEVRRPKGEGPLDTHFTSETRGMFRLTRGHVQNLAPISGARAWRNIDPETPDEFILITSISTAVVYKQFGRVAEVPRGGMVLLDARSPYEFERRVAGAISCHHFPGFLLRATSAHPEDLCARPIAPQGLGKVIRSQIGTIWRHIEDLDDSLRNRLMGDVAALVPLACREISSPAPLRTPHMLRAIDMIERHLEDPLLDVAMVAAGIGLSVSHLHALARRHGKGIGAMIQIMRLERAARILRDKRQDMKITSLAYHLGFADAAHFSRSFTRHFGLSPRQYRAAHHGADTAILHG